MSRNGNWQERQSHAANIARLREQQACGSLRSDVHARRVAAGLAPVELSSRRAAPYGLPVVLVQSGGGVLAACCTTDESAISWPTGDSTACLASLAASAAAQPPGFGFAAARCAVVLERCASLLGQTATNRQMSHALCSVAPRSVEDEAHVALCHDSACVSYGDKLRLRLCEQDGLLLSSTHLTPTCCSKSKRQLVAWAATGDAAESLWKILPSHVSSRAAQLALEGSPLPFGAPFSLLHVPSGQSLSAERTAPRVSSSCWGAEVEVAACSRPAAGVSHSDALMHESRGRAESAVVALAEENVWRFAGATEEAD
jgi:hypothetical protein